MSEGDHVSRGLLSPVVLVAILTAIGGWGTAGIKILGDMSTTSPSHYQVLYTEMTTLRTELTAAYAEVFRLKSDRIDALSLTGADFEEAQLQAIYAYVEGIKGRPAWCKRVEHDPTKVRDPDFIMGYPNTKYSFTYAPSREFYTGQNDFDVYPFEIANEFYKADLETYELKNYHEFREVVEMDDGSLEARLFGKFYVRVSDKIELVCGIELGKDLKELIEDG